MTEQPPADTAVDEPLPIVSPAEQARIEAAVERLKAADAARDSKTPVKQSVEQAMLELRRRMSNPQPDLAAAAVREHGQVWDDQRAHQAQVRTQAWHNDLIRADQGALAGWTVDQLADDQHPQWLSRFVECIGHPGKPLNLILHGHVGPGKTSAAIAAGNLAASRGLTVRFVKHSAYLRWLRPGMTPDGVTAGQVLTRYRQCALLILDDLGAGLDVNVEASRHVEQETEDLVGDRVTAGRTTIFTTNLGKDELVTILGPRAMSRVSGGAVPRHFTGPDRRNPVTW